MKEFHCGDVVPGCSARFKAESEAGILAQVGQHALRDHGMSTIPDGLVDQVRSHIVEVTTA